MLVSKTDLSLQPVARITTVLALALFFAVSGPLHAEEGKNTRSTQSEQGAVLRLGPMGLKVQMQLDPNLLLIDIRRKEELTGPLGKIPQARHVPLKKIKADPEQFPRNRTLVLICRSGNRSLEAAKLLARHGYIVYTLEGGMRGWRAMQSENGATPPAPSREIQKQIPEVPEDNRPKHEFFGQDMGC